MSRSEVLALATSGGPLPSPAAFVALAGGGGAERRGAATPAL